VFDLLNSVVRKFYAGKFLLDQYRQLQLIEGIKNQSGRRSATPLLSTYEARRISANIAKLPELLC
jgi:hypothetical protein